jgi:hypothetical protein
MGLLVDRSSHDLIWLADRDEIPDREKHMIQSPKLMPMFVWNPHGFQLVDAMPCHAMPCQQETCSRPPKISEIFSPKSLLGVERGERKLVVHVDNARPHTAKVARASCDDNFLRIARYPLYSLSVTPFDFFLFLVWVSQNRFQGHQSGSADEILSGVRKIRDEISVDTLEAVFWEWINKSDRCIAALHHCSNWKVRGMRSTIIH